MMVLHVSKSVNLPKTHSTAKKQPDRSRPGLAEDLRTPILSVNLTGLRGMQEKSMKHGRNLSVFLFGAIFAAVSACSPSAEQSAINLRVDAATAVTVNGEPVYVSDVELDAAAQGIIAPGEPFTADHPQFQKVLDQLIDQRLMAQEARRLGLESGHDAKRRLKAAEERILGNILVESLVATEVDEDAIKRMYNEQVSLQQINDEVRIRHILVADEATAKKVIVDLKGGGDFSALAFEYSTDKKTRLDGGEIGFVSPNLMEAPFPAVIGNTQVGEYSEPFSTESGWHIIHVDERRQPAPKSLEQMRPEIVSFLTFTEISKILRALRADAAIDRGRGGRQQVPLNNVERADPPSPSLDPAEKEKDTSL